MELFVVIIQNVLKKFYLLQTTHQKNENIFQHKR